MASVLPTSLRPPPEDPTTSSEFSPDAPPDDSQSSILGNLARGTSAGAGLGDGLGTGPGRSISPQDRRARNCPYGVGDPPRQVESIYAAPCAPAWKGDNGGETSKNVFRGELRLAFYHSVDGCEGPIPTEPTPDETTGQRTMRVFQDYVNQSFQTYGRRIRLYCMAGGASEDAVQADEEWKAFAAASIDFRACRELVRRKIPVFCDPPGREEMLAKRPYLWSWQMDRSAMQEMGAQYYCRKLVGEPARFAGENSGYRTVKRKLGILTETSEESGLTHEPMIPALRRECGITERDIVHITYTASGGQDVSAEQAATAIARLKFENVTTAVINLKFYNHLLTFNAADSAAYYPEWLIFSPYGLDINVIGTLMPQTQMTQVFGLSGWEWTRPPQDTACYRAYKQMDPNNDPNGGTCGLFDPLIQLMSGIQTAGPTLTPETFRDGLVSLGYRYYPGLPWAIGGGYSATDLTYIDNVAEIWWDPSQTAPDSGTPGAYRWVRCGKRYAKGELPREEPLVFRDGAPAPGLNGCPPA